MLTSPFSIQSKHKIQFGIITRVSVFIFKIIGVASLQ